MIAAEEIKNRRFYPYCLAGSGSSCALDLVTAASLSDSASLELSDPDELDSSSFAGSFILVAFTACFCWLAGSGELERLELLSLSEEDDADMIIRQLSPVKSCFRDTTGNTEVVNLEVNSVRLFFGRTGHSAFFCLSFIFALCTCLHLHLHLPCRHETQG